MKKLLAVFLFLGVLSTGVYGALSTLPHAHGDDLDHSRHASCPVHQLGSDGFQAVTVSHDAFTAKISSDFLIVFPAFFTVFYPQGFLPLRAPPING